MSAIIYRKTFVPAIELPPRPIPTLTVEPTARINEEERAIVRLLRQDCSDFLAALGDEVDPDPELKNE